MKVTSFPETRRLSRFALACLVAQLLLLLLTNREPLHGNEVISLSGVWQVHLDRTGKHLSGEFAEHLPKFQDSNFAPVTLPGSLQESGLGDAVGPETKWITENRVELWNSPKFSPYRRDDNFKIPFWWQPERRFLGLAWYRKRVDVPASWIDKRIVLKLERPHWQTAVYVDGQLAGSCDSLGTVHQFDLTDLLTPGRHELMIGIDNRSSPIDVGINAHSVSDHTQTAWHGIVGAIELIAKPKLGIESIQIHPTRNNSLRLVAKFANDRKVTSRETLRLRVTQAEQQLGNLEKEVVIPVGGASIEIELELSQSGKRWNEFFPNLCQLVASLQSDPSTTFVQTFGLRDVSTADGQFLIDGAPIFLRGTLECCVFPLSGYPATDLASWKRIIGICKAHGLNHIRFHSWCPPEAAFVAADEMGFYYQVECSSWPNQSTSLGAGEPLEEWLYREADLMLEAYGNHPSLLLMAAGNEPDGPNQGADFLTTWVEHFNAKDDRMLFTCSSGWPSLDANQYHVWSAPRIHNWGDQLRSRINARQPETRTDYRELVQRFRVPVVSHEIGQWCVYPNFEEIKKYTGTLKAKNLEIFKDFLDQAQMLDQADDFLMASGKLQTLCYKEEIESSLRTPNFGGFQMLDLRDFPGQGSAIVGMLDPFWDPKPYVSAREIRKFCGPIVPLARMSKRTWQVGETFTADVEVAHYGPQSFDGVRPRWKLFNGNVEYASGEFKEQDIAKSGLRAIGRIEHKLTNLTVPTRLKLVVSLPGDIAIETEATGIENDWNLWVFPEQLEITYPSDLLVVEALNNEALARLDQGGKVLLLMEPIDVESDVVLGFSPIFWNTAWTYNQAPHTLGLLCNPKHAVFNHFVTDFHTDWHWWGMINGARPMDLSKLPASLQPILQVVPDWYSPKKLGLAFEAKVANGKLLVCSIDLKQELANRFVARQFLHSLLRYADSVQFNPEVELRPEQITGLFHKKSNLEELRAAVTSNSQEFGYPAEQAIDGNPNTIWHSAWSPEPTPLPHWLLIDLKVEREVTGIKCLPRGDMSRGRIQSFRVLVSDDGSQWSEVKSGEWSDDATWKLVEFATVQNVRYIKLISKQEVSGAAYTSLAEVDVLMPLLAVESRDDH